MAAVVAQYIRANKLTEKTGLTARALAQSLLMSTAVPMYQDYGEGKYGYYSVMQQRRPCQCGCCRFRRHLHQDG